MGKQRRALMKQERESEERNRDKKLSEKLRKKAINERILGKWSEKLE